MNINEKIVKQNNGLCFSIRKKLCAYCIYQMVHTCYLPVIGTAFKISSYYWYNANIKNGNKSKYLFNIWIADFWNENECFAIHLNSFDSWNCLSHNYLILITRICCVNVWFNFPGLDGYEIIDVIRKFLQIPDVSEIYKYSILMM